MKVNSQYQLPKLLIHQTKSKVEKGKKERAKLKDFDEEKKKIINLLLFGRVIMVHYLFFKKGIH